MLIFICVIQTYFRPKLNCSHRKNVRPKLKVIGHFVRRPCKRYFKAWVNKKFVPENIEQGNQRKQEVMFEIKSMRSRSGSRASSMSSTALRAKARAEAAAAIKKAEIYKKRSLLQSQSVLTIQSEELSLAKRKLDEQTRLEALRLEGDAAIAVARAKVIDDELGFDISREQNPIDLPVENPQTRVQQFIDDQYLQPQTNDPEPTSRDTGNTQQTPSHHLSPMVTTLHTQELPNRN